MNLPLTENPTVEAASKPVRAIQASVQSPQEINGRYRLVRPLGAGSFGRTYLARDMHLPGLPLCAVKQLITQNRTPADVRRARQMFDQEAKVLQSLSHPQIPKLQAYFSHQKRSYLVMDMVIGRLVYDFVTPKSRLSEIYVQRLLMSALNALVFLHGRGIIHRDVKPANLIWRESDGEIVLLDFGTVEIADTSAKTHPKAHFWYSRHAVATSIGYMPEEQRRSRSRFSNDLYALGMTAIEAATGRAFSRLHDDRKRNALRWQPWATHISEGLATVLSTMVHPNVGDRYPTAQLARTAVLKASSTVSLLKQSYPNPSKFSSDDRDVSIDTRLPTARRIFDET